MTDQRNLILAVIITFIILLGYDYFYIQPQMEADRGQQTTEEQQPQEPSEPLPDAAPAKPARETPGGDLGAPEAERPTAARQSVIGDTARVAIESPRVTGSFNLEGGRIDALRLRDYHVTVDENSPTVVLLSPSGTRNPYYADFGWLAPAGSDPALPGGDTQWQASGERLAPGNPVTLTWENGNGLVFRRTIELDENYMFTVTQTVENTSGEPVQLAPFGRIARTGTPDVSGFFILHEGAVGVFDGVLEELDYESIREDSPLQYESTGGWVGITDKYWLTALVPDQSARFTGGVRHGRVGPDDRYQTDVLYDTRIIQPGATESVTSHFFAGAKEVDVIEGYTERLEIDRFDLAIDWGWFRWLTQPIFHALDFFRGILGNFGLAILALTVVIKLIFFPLANKSYVAMSRMKKLQPKMKEIQEKYKDDRTQQQQEMMKLYREEKVNPVAGCLPVLIQIPVFFALYKVLFVTIEMRHAPFFGWVKDLSAPDPALILTGFGLFPWDVPSFLAIGIWPVLMGVSMWLQQRLNPQATDPVQQKIFTYMPIIFAFILARFPVGLVIYWTWNNLLSAAQQWVIMKRVARES